MGLVMNLLGRLILKENGDFTAGIYGETCSASPLRARPWGTGRHPAAAVSRIRETTCHSAARAGCGNTEYGAHVISDLKDACGRVANLQEAETETYDVRAISRISGAKRARLLRESCRCRPVKESKSQMGLYASAFSSASSVVCWGRCRIRNNRQKPQTTWTYRLWGEV